MSYFMVIGIMAAMCMTLLYSIEKANPELVAGTLLPVHLKLWLFNLQP